MILYTYYRSSKININNPNTKTKATQPQNKQKYVNLKRDYNN